MRMLNDKNGFEYGKNYEEEEYLQDSFDEDEYMEECVEEYEEEDDYWLYELTKHDIIDLAIEAAMLRRKGEEFTLPMLLYDVWDGFNPTVAKQASKEFKIKVLQRIITCVYLVSGYKIHGCWVYRRR